MKATKQYFPRVLFIMLYKVFLRFESVYKILKCDHSNESSKRDDDATRLLFDCNGNLAGIQATVRRYLEHNCCTTCFEFQTTNCSQGLSGVQTRAFLFVFFH